MSLAKTEKAKIMLSRRDGGLSAKERQILIMCNASRSYDDFVKLFGSDVELTLDRLIRGALIMDVQPREIQDHGALSQTGTFYSSELKSSDRMRFEPQDAQTPSFFAPLAEGASPTSKASSASAPTSNRGKSSTEPASQKPSVEAARGDTKIRGRRSIAASKMYIVNLLQLHRDLDASTLTLNLHTSEDEEQLFACILASLHYISAKAGSEYCRRVCSQLEGTLPEAHLPGLAAFVKDVLNDSPSFLVV
jgi:hypothetical protein